MSVNKEFVKFDKVDKSYDGKVLVVKDLQLDIAEGEFITMLGPSGSGKTTCLMMLAGFETPTNGEIYLDGNAISSIPPHKRGIGMVFQNYALFPHLTVYENLAFPLKVRKLSKDIEKVKKDYFEIAKIGDKTLKDTKYNKKYESILKAQQEILSLIGELSNQKMMQKEVNEGMMDLDKARKLPDNIQKQLIQGKDEYDRAWDGVFVPMGKEGSSQRKEYERRGKVFKAASAKYKALLTKHKVMKK